MEYDPFLLQVYRAARINAADDFQRTVVALLRVQFPFVSMMWGNGLLMPDRSTVVPTALYKEGLDDEFLRRSAQRAGHGLHAGALLSHARDRRSILWPELPVLRLFLHVNTLRYEVLHFRFEAAHRFLTRNWSSHDGFVRPESSLCLGWPKPAHSVQGDLAGGAGGERCLVGVSVGNRLPRTWGFGGTLRSPSNC